MIASASIYLLQHKCLRGHPWPRINGDCARPLRVAVPIAEELLPQVLQGTGWNA